MQPELAVRMRERVRYGPWVSQAPQTPLSSRGKGEGVGARSPRTGTCRCGCWGGWVWLKGSRKGLSTRKHLRDFIRTATSGALGSARRPLRVRAAQRVPRAGVGAGPRAGTRAAMTPRAALSARARLRMPACKWVGASCLCLWKGPGGGE